MNVTYIKGGEEVEKTITPVKTSKNTYKLGIWVRDAGAGVGTLSFYDETANTIASASLISTIFVNSIPYSC